MSSLYNEDGGLNIGGKYNFKNQPEKLIYLGYNWSGNGYWHQFAKEDSPEEVWSEILTNELWMIESARGEVAIDVPNKLLKKNISKNKAKALRKKGISVRR